jgi:hypothetical protein
MQALFGSALHCASWRSRRVRTLAVPTLPMPGRAIAYERELGGIVSLRPILREARLWRAPQDEVLFRGEILDPHGEERRLRRVSNHEAEYAIGPYAIALRCQGIPRYESDIVFSRRSRAQPRLLIST